MPGSKQHGFFQVVRQAQSGNIPLNQLSPAVAHAAKRVTPHDPHAYHAQSHAELPEIKDSTQCRPGSQMSKVAMTARFIKFADLAAAVKSTEKALRSLSDSRRKVLSDHVTKQQQHVQKLQSENEKMQVENEKMRMQVTQSQHHEMLQQQKMEQQKTQAAMQQAALGQSMQTGPTPPAAQTPYGDMLIQQQMLQQQAQK